MRLRAQGRTAVRRKHAAACNGSPRQPTSSAAREMYFFFPKRKSTKKNSFRERGIPPFPKYPIPTHQGLIKFLISSHAAREGKFQHSVLKFFHTGCDSAACYVLQTLNKAKSVILFVTTSIFDLSKMAIKTGAHAGAPLHLYCKL